MNKNDFVQAKSTIAIEYSKGVKAIQVYYNGSFDRMGKNLLKNYSKWQKTLQMMRKGTLIVLGDNLKPYSNDNKGGTLDLAMKGLDPVPNVEYSSVAELIETETDSEYVYLWRDNKWYATKVADGLVYMGGGFFPLTSLV